MTLGHGTEQSEQGKENCSTARTWLGRKETIPYADIHKEPLLAASTLTAALNRKLQTSNYLSPVTRGSSKPRARHRHRVLAFSSLSRRSPTLFKQLRHGQFSQPCAELGFHFGEDGALLHWRPPFDLQTRRAVVDFAHELCHPDASPHGDANDNLVC